MMSRLHVFIALLVMSSGISQAHACGQSEIVAAVEVTNNSAFPSQDEIVSLANTYGCDIIVTDKDGNEIPSQITHDNNLIFPATVDAGATATYNIVKGIRHNYPTVSYGRFVPERDDDFAWENDLTAYRAYGPATCKKGGKAYGYDVWTKNVPYPIIEKRYYDHIKGGKSYHKNFGNGMDAYAVGRTLGAGAPALIDAGGQLVFNNCFYNYEVIDTGPLRFTFKLYYPGEERLISLDAGSHFNYSEVKFLTPGEFDKACVGIVSHIGDSVGSIIDKTGSVVMVGYQDPTDNPCDENGNIYVGILMDDSNAKALYIPFLEQQGQATGHYVISTDLPSDNTLRYWWGTAWDKADTKDIEEWHERMAEKVNRILHPLSIKVEQ